MAALVGDGFFYDEERMSDLQRKLLASSAVKSSVAEGEVAGVCSAMGWKTIRSAYFADPATKKLREVDVSASMRWAKNASVGQSNNLYATLTFLIEVKSMSGFHLIFDGIEKAEYALFQVIGYCGWPGYFNPQRKAKIADLLRRHAFDSKEIVTRIDGLSAVAYPDDTVRAFDVFIRPSKAAHIVGSFRETNTEIEKELDNSVLWKACLALRSAVDAVVEDDFDHFLQDFETDIFLYRKQGEEDWLDNSMFSHSSSVDFYHPVIVTGAHLWEVVSGQLQKVKSVRLYIRDQSGRVLSWFDVVQEAHFKEWFVTHSRHYIAAFAANAAEVD